MREENEGRVRTAIITGGGSGIGAALAREIARRGVAVVIADRHGDAAKAIAAEILASGARAEAEPALDVRDAGAVEALVASVASRFGRLDYLFNNAGIGVGGEALDYGIEDWRDVIEVNLMGVIHGVQAGYGRMVRQGFGHIVNTASMSGLMPSPFTVSYGTAKHGVVGLSRSLRTEAAAYGVKVTVLCPGVIRTPILQGGRYGRMTKPVPPQVQLAMMEQLRPMDPDRFARRALDAVARNREVVVIPSWWKMVWWINRLSPGLGSALAARGFRRFKRVADAASTSPST